MKLITLLAAILLTTGIGCAKKMHTQRKESTGTDFTFRAKKNGIKWKASSMAATYNPKDSMMHVMALGSNNERLTISFLKEPQHTGASKQFTANSMTPTCEYCASIAQQYSMDSLKQNSFQVMGFDDIKKRVLGKFSFYLKKDSLYQGPFVKDASFYEGVFSVPYETLSF